MLALALTPDRCGAVLCIDDMIRIVKTLPRKSRGEEGTVEDTPPERKDRCAAFRPEAGTVWREHFAGRYNPVTRLAQKCDPRLVLCPSPPCPS